MEKVVKEGANNMFLLMFLFPKDIPVPSKFWLCEPEMKWFETEPYLTGKYINVGMNIKS